MPLPESEIRAVLKAAGAFIEKRRPPPAIREKLDLRADITGSEVVIVEVRPDFQNESKKRDFPVARMRWFNSRKVWRLFWQRADLKWHAYPPRPEAAKISTLIKEVDRDPHGCFFG